MNEASAESSVPAAREPVTSGRAVRRDPRASARTHHATFLAMSVAVIVLSLVLANEGQSAVTMAGWKLPPICPLYAATGIDCPGCGLTRAFVAIGHGHFVEGFHFHRLGIALYILTLYQFVYRPIMIRRAQDLPPEPLASVHRWVSYGLIAALLGNWIWNRLG